MSYQIHGKHLIAGKWTGSNETFESSAAKGPNIKFSKGSEELVNEACSSAEEAFEFFSDLNIQALEIFFDQILNFVKEFNLRGVPTTILINKNGEEFARIIGEVNFQDKKFLKWLLKYD